ncbi:hypothetical protein N7540_011326 [Penicillium herquei]|nr:hypothetical protein N7540_011326 [Penicillium herquei]
MSVQAEAYFETQTRLTAWTDELEFLGYILCELIDADGLSTRGYRCHQAVDLPAIVDIVRLQLEEPNGSLAKVMREDELKTLRRLMKKAKQIRNKMAHHTIQDEKRLKFLESTKRSLCDLLEYAIKMAALERGISQITWSPCHHICKAYTERNEPLIVTVPLNGGSLLSLRQRVLRDHDITQQKLIYRRPRNIATEESRQKQKDNYEAAVARRRQRQERHMAVQSSCLTEKLQKLEQRFNRSQELRSTQINVVKEHMRIEQEIFHRQRTEILQKGVLQPVSGKETLLTTVFLAISSPLWIPGVLIYYLYKRHYV